MRAIQTSTKTAPVIDLHERRRARRSRHRRVGLARPLISLWLGAIAFAVLAALGALASAVLPSGIAGVIAAIVVLSALAYPLSQRVQRLVKSRSAPGVSWWITRDAEPSSPRGPRA